MTLNVQGAKTEDAYNEALDAIQHRFGKPTRDYIAGIDPVHWCVFANMPHYIPNNHRFTPAPLFNWRSTNFVESDNNNMLINGLRKATPFGMLQRIMRTMMMDATARGKIKIGRTLRLQQNCETRSDSKQDRIRSMKALQVYFL